MGDHEEETRAPERSRGNTREGAGQGRKGQGKMGILLCAALGVKGPRGKVQSTSGQWHDVHGDMFRRDNIPVGAGQGDQCWRCTKEAGQVPWLVMRTTAWAFLTATMRTTDARGQSSGPVLRLPREMQEEEEAQEGMEVWLGAEQEGKRAGVQIGWDTVRGLQEEDDEMALSFRMMDTGRPEEEAPIVPVGYKFGESARMIGLMVRGLPPDRVWYLVLMQAYLKQGRAKGDRAWCHGVVVTKGWKAKTDNKWAVYRGVKELSVEDGVLAYDIGRHRVYSDYPREVVRIPEPTEDRVVTFLEGVRDGRTAAQGMGSGYTGDGVGTGDRKRGEKDGVRASVPWRGTSGGGRG